VAEHVRHFQPIVGHGTRASGGYEVRGGWWDSRQRFEWAGGGAHFAGGDQQVSCRGAEIAMSEQQLNGAQVGARLQQVNGERVAQGMRCHRFRDAALGPHLPANVVDGERADWLIRPITGKQPGTGMGSSPILPEQIEQPWETASRSGPCGPCPGRPGSPCACCRWHRG
jgi:hypothetical protein